MTTSVKLSARDWQIQFALALMTVIAFWPVRHFEFLDYDDPGFVTENAYVQQGLTYGSIAWALRAKVVSNWHPVTCLSHIFDWEMFGDNAGAHHLMNLFFHVLNTILLFRVLQRATSELWPSAVVAALFAVHPLHVESVAWISERKDLLCTLFGLLTLGAYINYAKSAANKAWPRNRSYWLAVLFFALGLMSKPMLVTWPFVLLLLDLWPLKRFSVAREFAPEGVPHATPVTVSQLIWEKIPFFLLTFAVSALTFYMQRRDGAMKALNVTVSDQISNALISYVRYVHKTIWPADLAVLYPYPGSWPMWQAVGASVFLAAVTAIAFLQRQRYPALLVGWLWFLGTLVPVIGLIQVGYQAMADRYTYIPLIGLFIMAVWTARSIVLACRLGRVVTFAASVACILGCIIGARLQLRYWQNNDLLFQRALDVTENNFLAEIVVGRTRINQGKLDEAIVLLKEGLRLKPDIQKGAQFRFELADALVRAGRVREAIDQYHEVIRLQPDSAMAHNNIAWILATTDDSGIRDGAEAIRTALRGCELSEYQQAICIGTLAAAYAERGQFDEAVKTAERARDVASAAGQKALAAKNGELIENYYRVGKPYRELRTP